MSEFDKISSYVDRSGLEKDTDFFLSQFEKIEAGAESAAKNLKVAFGKLETAGAGGSTKQMLKEMQTMQITTADYSKILQEVAINVDKLTKKQKDQLKVLNETYIAEETIRQGAKQTAKLIETEIAQTVKLGGSKTELAKKIAENKAAQDALNRENKLAANLAKTERNSLGRAQALILVYTNEKKKLNLATEEGTRLNENYNKAIAKANDFILKNADSETKRVKNIGNYSQAVTVLKDSLNEVSKKIEKYTKSGQTNSAVLKSLQKEYDLLNKLVNSQEVGFANATQEIRANQRALLEMEQAGLRGTDAFNKLAEATGKLQDDIADLKARTKTLGSDTFAFDSMIQGAQTLAGVYGAAQGAAALFGEENEDLQKTFVKLQAIMTIIQGLQSVQNGIQKESAFILGVMSLKEKALAAVQTIRNFIIKGTIASTVQSTAATEANIVATETQTVATEATTVATVGATAAMKALRFAMVATGFGAAIVLIAAIAYKMSEMANETNNAASKMEDLDKQIQSNSEQYERETAAIDRNLERKRLLNQIKIDDESERKKIQLNDDLNAAYEKRDKKIKELDATQKLIDAENDKRTARIIESIKDAGKMEDAQRKVFMQVLLNSSAIKEYDNNIKNLNNTYGKQVTELATITNSAEVLRLQAQADAAEERRKQEEKDKEDAKKRAEDRAKKAAEYAKKEAAALLQIFKDSANERADAQKKIADDDTVEIEDRLAAEYQYFKEKKSILDAEYQYAKKDKTKTVSEQLAIDNKYRIDSAALEQERLKERTELLKKFDDKQTAELKKRNDEQLQTLVDANEKKKLSIEEQYTLDTQRANERYLANITSEEEYQKEKANAENKYREASLKAEIKYTKEVIELMKSRGIDVTKELQNVAKIERELSDETVKKTTKDDKEKAASAKDVVAQISKMYGEVFDVISGAYNASATAQKNIIQEQINDIEKKSEKEIEAVNASTLSEAEKADKIAIINARATAQKEALARQEKEIDIKKAKFDKANAIAQIIINTASAIVSDLKYPWKIAFDAAIGAAQLAIAVSTPIPKYKHGLDHDYEGLAIVGDGGKHEVHEHADGTYSITPDTDTLTYIRKGDRIHSDADVFMRDLHDSALRDTARFTKGEAITEKSYGAAMINHMAKHTELLNKISNKGENHISAKDGALVSIWKYGANMSKYLNENSNW